MNDRQGGFSYLIALFMLAAVAIAAQRILQTAWLAELREREADLLFAGQAYRAAIRQYYEQTPGSAKHYPPSLEALLLDERSVRIRRPLRRLYADPIDPNGSWAIIPAPDGGVMGVHSQSHGQPFKVTGFPPDLAHFSDATSYQDWQFIYLPD